MPQYRPSISWRDSYNPLRSLTLSRIVAMEEAGDRGEYADLQWLWRHMVQTDVTVAAAVSKRVGLISSLDWEIRTIEGRDPVLAAEQADVLRYAYERIENLTEAATKIALGNFTGFSILEKIKTGYGPLIKRLEYVPCHFWVRDLKERRWKFNPEARAGAGQGELADESDLLIYVAENALFRAIGRHFFAKQLAMADWDVALENGANQAIFVSGPPGTTPAKELEYQAMAEAVVSNLRGYLPPGATVSVTDLAARGTMPYFSRIDYSDKQIVMAATGGLLTMLTESGSGTLAGGAHSESLMQLARADAADISETFQRQIDIPTLREFFPGEQICVYFKYDTPKEQETLAQIIEAVSAFSWAGYRIEQGQLEEKTGFKLEQIAPPGE